MLPTADHRSKIRGYRCFLAVTILGRVIKGIADIIADRYILSCNYIKMSF